MDAPRVLLETKERRSFCYQDGYDSTSVEELKALLQISRNTVLSLEEELSRRLEHLRPLSNEVRSCVEKLHSGMSTLEVTQRLDDPNRLILGAVETLEKEATNRKERIYKQFLKDILQQCGHSLVILCSWKIGKRRIVDLRNLERVELLRYLKMNLRLFNHQALDYIATKYRIGAAPSGPPDNATTAQPVPIERHTEIEYKYSESAVHSLELVGLDLYPALKTSKQWTWEEQTAEDAGLPHTTTDCITVLSPKNRGDIAFQILLGFEEGSDIIESLRMTAI